jgi:hypothetical protein
MTDDLPTETERTAMAVTRERWKEWIIRYVQRQLRIDPRRSRASMIGSAMYASSGRADPTVVGEVYDVEAKRETEDMSFENNAHNAYDFAPYRRRQIAELRPWRDGESMDRISVSAADKDAGSPKAGDMIARNPKNHDDQWLVAALYFSDNFEPV